MKSNELSAGFRSIRLILSREPGHPEGERERGYDLLVPLDNDGRIDSAEWKKNQAQCRVRRFERGVTLKIGRLRRRPGGQWYFDYEEGESDDEIGFRLGEECFRVGEYVSIKDGKIMHTYQVARVEKP